MPGTDNGIPVPVLGSKGSCGDDIKHYKIGNDCWQVSCNNLLGFLQKNVSSFPPGLACPNGYLTATPNYWYDNGFASYIKSCPADNCNLTNWYTKILTNQSSKSNLQCNGNWSGFACGKCNYSANFSIRYDTSECVHKDHNECWIKSVTHSLLILFAVSAVYWIIIVFCMFYLLYLMKFNVKAGYAYGIIFYYSVLEHIVVIFDEIVQTENCGFSNDEHYDQCFFVQNNHALLKRHLLLFLSAIGTLKPPFMRYMHLCLGNLEKTDHIFSLYIHPLIVMFIVTVLYISARRFVIVAKHVGKIMSSTSICILLLLSYSSVSHTSIQLLRPLPYFEYNGSSTHTHKPKGWRSHWSPTHDHYFHGRQKYYFIVAILCELVIGFGLPIFLLLQRHLICYLKLNFASIKQILDQLQGCYKKEYYWFAAYYLICRQVIYLVDVFIVFEVFLWTDHISVKLVTMLIIGVVILAIHLWFQPYNTTEEAQTKHLNILDGAILFTLVILLVCSLDGRSNGISVLFWILPLFFLCNYLTYSTKLKDMFALGSIYVVVVLAITLVFFLPRVRYYYLNFVSVLFLLTSFCAFMLYIVMMIKDVCKNCYHRWHQRDHNDGVIGEQAQIFDFSVESAGDD